EEAHDALITKYEAQRTRDMQELKGRMRHLARHFNGRRLASITTSDSDRYIIARRGEGASNGTIINELDLLIRNCRIAYDAGRLERMPRIEKPKAGAARSGFVTDAQWDAVYQRLPEELRAPMATAFEIGWRKEELFSMRKGQYNASAGTLRLE